MSEESSRVAWFGVRLLADDRVDDAHAAGLVATALDAKDALAWHVLGCAAGRAGREGEALLALVQAVKLNQANTRAWTDLGELYVRRLDYARAAEALGQVLRLDPTGKTAAGKRAQVLVVSTLMALQ